MIDDMDIEELANDILRILRDTYHLDATIVRASTSLSRYIQINEKCIIRVSDHYSHRDYFCKYNIGPHITSFGRLKGSFYYQEKNKINLIHRLLKDQIWKKKKQ